MRKKTVIILVWRGRGSNLRPPDYEANALSTRPPSRFVVRYCESWTTCILRQKEVVDHEDKYIGELVFYAIFQPYKVIYGGQFPQVIS